MAQFVPLGFFAYPRYNWDALLQLPLESPAVKHADQTVLDKFFYSLANLRNKYLQAITYQH